MDSLFLQGRKLILIIQHSLFLQLHTEVEKPLLTFRGDNFKKDLKKYDHHIADLRKQLASRFAGVEKVTRRQRDESARCVFLPPADSAHEWKLLLFFSWFFTACCGGRQPHGLLLFQPAGEKQAFSLAGSPSFLKVYGNLQK